ncbi:MAG TPA: GNVR domain-containing protein [Thermoanaerobaculia bacterium]|nr:GNVR domain-containing protein [Thermoanaerobaculia bacterium]
MAEASTPHESRRFSASAGEGLRKVFVYRRGLFLGVSVTTFLFVQILAFFWPGTFAARAALLVQQTRVAARLSAASREPAVTVKTGAVPEEEVNSEIAVLTSREVLAATVRATGLDRAPSRWYLRALYAPLRVYENLYASFHGLPPPDPGDRAIRSLGDSLSAERLKNSDILVVTVEAGDPHLAKVVLDQLLKHYLLHHLEVHGAGDVLPFFNRQASVLSRELAQHEEDLANLRHRLGAVDLAAERESQLAMDVKLREEDAMLGRRQVELDGQIATYDRALAAAAQSRERSQTLPADPTLQDFKSQVLRLELEQIRLESRYRDDSPLVAENRAKLDVARHALEEERRNVLEHSPNLIEMDRERAKCLAERAGIEERRAALADQLRRSHARLMELDGKTTESSRLQRLIRAAEEKYMMYLARGEEARIDSALDQHRFANISIVQQPAASLSPVRPKKLVVLLTSVVGGILAGVLTCLGLELRAVGLGGLLAALTTEPVP